MMMKRMSSVLMFGSLHIYKICRNKWKINSTKTTETQLKNQTLVNLNLIKYNQVSRNSCCPCSI